MTHYRYRGCDGAGQIVRGVLSADSLAALDRKLAGRQIELIHARQIRPLWQRPAPRRELIHFCFQLEQLLGAGVPLIDALSEISDDRELTPRSTHIATIAADLRAEIERGQSLSEALALHPRTFNEVSLEMIRAGEQTGDLAPVLARIGANLTRSEEIEAHAKKIAIYPIILGCTLTIAVIVAVTQVVPQVARLFQMSGEPLPLPTRLLLASTSLLTKFGWIALLLILIGSLLIRAVIARNAVIRLQLHALSLHLPLFGPLWRQLSIARAADVIAMLYAAGITVTDALASAARVTSNLAIRREIESALKRIHAGQSLGTAFSATRLFPGLVTRMLKLGEQTGRLDTALAQVVRFYERDTLNTIERLQASAEPVMVIIMGCIMLWIAVAILGPVYDIVTKLPL